MSELKPKVEILNSELIGDTLSLKVRLNYPDSSVEKTINWPLTETKEEVERQLRMIWEQNRPEKPKIKPEDIADLDWDEK